MIISQNFTYRNPTYIISAIALFLAFLGLINSNGPGLFTIFEVIGVVIITVIIIRITEILFQFREAKKQFFTWAEAWDKLTQGKLFNAGVNLVGRNKTLESLYSMIQDRNVRAIIISGPPCMGKTRLALEAAKKWQNKTLIAKDAQSLSIDSLSLKDCSIRSFFERAFSRTEHQEPGIISILEDLTDGRTNDFLGKISELKDVKFIIISLTANRIIDQTRKNADWIKAITLSRITDDEPGELLDESGVELDFNLKQWIIKETDGNPGVLMFAASYGKSLRKDVSGFIDAVKDLYEQKIRQAFVSDDIIQKLQLLSLLQNVGVRNPSGHEIELICSLFGNGIPSSFVLQDLPKLAELGLIENGGVSVEVLPHIFATGLAKSTMLGRAPALLDLFKKLDETGRIRLVRRLQLIESEEVDNLWNTLFLQGNELGDIQSALSNSYLLHPMTGAVPARIVNLLEDGLKKMSIEERKSVLSEPNRYLVKNNLIFTLNDLLLRKETGDAAANCLVMLAEIEAIDQDNQAASALFAFFRPRNPQVPLSLVFRLKIIKDICSSSKSVQTRIVGINAISKTIKVAAFGGGMIPVTPSNGRPFDTYVETHETSGNFTKDFVELVDILMNAAQEEVSYNPSVRIIAKTALDVLPQAIVGLTLLSEGLKEAIIRFDTVVNWIVDGIMPVSVSGVYDALRFVYDRLSNAISERGDALPTEFREYAEQIRCMMDRIDQGSFSTRVKLWVDGWTSRDYEKSEEGKLIHRADTEISSLAIEAVYKPQLLMGHLLSWVRSEEAEKSYMFFEHLGTNDTNHRFIELMQYIGYSQSGVRAFAYYFKGLNKTNPEFAAKCLGEISREGTVLREAISAATASINGGAPTSEETKKAIVEDKINPEYIAWEILSAKQGPPSPDEYYQMLSHLQNAVAVIKMLSVWLSFGQPIEGQLAELAWKCLESAPSVPRNEYYDFDSVASEIAKADLKRGCRLLEILLKQPDEKNAWNPLSYQGKRQLWDLLQSVDRGRAVLLVLRTIMDMHIRNYQVPSVTDQDIRSVLDQTKDAGTLVSFALENMEQAEFVSRCLTMHEPNFWAIAFKIIEKYHRSKEVRDALTYNHDDEAGFGPTSEDIQKWRMST